MKRHIGLVYDLRSEYLAEGYSEEQVAEFDSDITIDSIEKVIRSLGYRVTRIGHARNLCRRLVRGERWDMVFNIAEGLAGRGRESQVPCLLELYGIPYTMSDPVVNGIGLDKAMAKKIVRASGVDTPAFHVVETPRDLADVHLRYPLFVKPVSEGTGKGVDESSKIANRSQLEKKCRALLRRYRQPVLVEEFLPGREFTVGVLGTGRDAKVLGIMEVLIDPSFRDKIYSYEVKERSEELVQYVFPSRGRLCAQIRDLVLRAYRALECRDCSRIDVRLDAAGKPAFIEVNTLPGLNPVHSDLPMIAKAAGMSFDQLIQSILASAFRRKG